MKIERTKRRGKGELALEITPLIDVVFLLLYFFWLQLLLKILTVELK